MIQNGFRAFLRFVLLSPLWLLSGCTTRHFWLFHPSGPVAGTEMHIMGIDVLILLLIVVPTALLLVLFLWRYRASREDSTYAPNWSHSTAIELVVWGVPVITVAILGYIAYTGIREVNPYDPTVVVTPPGRNPLTVDVITTDWKWLFIYPKQDIATVDRLVVPTHIPVHFKLTSATVTNSIFIPELVGQIYVMPGMRTEQSMLVSHPGTYDGFSATQSGPGFTWMQFQTKAVSEAGFKAWVHRIRHGSQDLTYAAFNTLAIPSINLHHKTPHYAQVEPGLFDHVIEEVRDGKVFPTHWAMTANMSRGTSK